MRELVVTSYDSGGRLDKYLLRFLPKSGKSFIYKMLRKKNIVLNGAKCAGNEITQSGDVITLFLSDETVARFSGAAAPKPPPAAGKLDILYEDGGVLILNKPPGLLSQPASPGGKDSDSVIGRVKAYLGDGFSPALCNRLDRNTSGLVMCGKNLAPVRDLNEAARGGKIRKIYLCVAVGHIKEETVLRDNYFKDSESNTGHIAVTGEGSEIVTRIKPLAYVSGYSLAEAELVTGRSHQIRLQLQNAGYPVLGDNKYGSPEANVKARMEFKAAPRSQCLHAHRLIFNTDGGLLYLKGAEFTASPPKLFYEIFRRYL